MAAERNVFKIMEKRRHIDHIKQEEIGDIDKANWDLEKQFSRLRETIAASTTSP